jgi:hypothetical protein
MLNGQALKIISWLLEFMPGWMTMLRKLIYKLIFLTLDVKYINCKTLKLNMLVCGRHSWYFYFSRFIPMSRREFMKLETSKKIRQFIL